MKKKYYWIVGVILIIILSFIFLLYFFNSNQIWKIGTCPSIKHIDCMPIVSPEFEIYCRPENRQWIQNNCPNILITD
jgi:hypothetical protein